MASWLKGVAGLRKRFLTSAREKTGQALLGQATCSGSVANVLRIATPIRHEAPQGPGPSQMCVADQEACAISSATITTEQESVRTDEKPARGGPSGWMLVNTRAETRSYDPQ